MGYSKLSYDDIIEHPEVWRDEKARNYIVFDELNMVDEVKRVLLN